MNEVTMYFQAEWMNWGMIYALSDTIIKRRWTVYSDGKVQATVEYCRSGISGIKEIKLKPEEMQELVSLVNNGFLSCEAYQECCDGEGWEMTLFDKEGTPAHKISGYIYGINELEAIADYFYRLPVWFLMFGEASVFNEIW